MGCEFVGFCEFFEFNQFNIIEWFIGVITTFALIFWFRAKIRVNEIFIKTDKKGKRKIKIPVLNNSYLFYATNVIIEVAIIEGDYSYHFELDRKEFILIPTKCFRNNCNANERTFQTLDFDENTYRAMNVVKSEMYYFSIFSSLVKENTKVRVRIHANHEFTNFGKAFEFNFRYDGERFIKI